MYSLHTIAETMNYSLEAIRENRTFLPWCFLADGALVVGFTAIGEQLEHGKITGGPVGGGVAM